MFPQDVREFLTRQPFQPFRVTLSDGRTYEVRHPELAMVGLSTVAFGIPPEGSTVPVYERLITVALSHVMQIEPLETPSVS